MSRDALIIGINQYKYLKPLDSPATDAEAIAQILEHQGGFTINRLPASEGIDAENRSIVTVADSGVITLPELKNALVQLFNPTSQKPPEVALFYFSGHGLREDQGGIQQGFLATTHSETKSYNNCLPLDWLRKLLRNSPVRQQIVWLDCCYSGELFNFAEADPGQRDQGFNRCFIAASRDFEAAIAPRTSDHSLFTEALLQALDYSQSAHGYIDNYQLAENLKQILKTSSFPQQPVYDNSGERPIVLTGLMYATKPAFGEDFCPYKGLRYFDNKPEDALFFKGRDKLIAELLTKVKTKPFLAVLGASGNGKSSVVRAGVLYQLQQTGGCEIVKPFTPTANPLTALTNGLGTTEVLTFVQASTKARVILTIDQFEEVFSLCQDPPARETFFNILLDAVEQATGKFCLIVVMRADFLDKCSNYPRLARYFQDHQHIVTRPTEDEIQQIIEAPAKQAGFLVEPRLVAEMVTDFKDSLGGLPLLEFALTTLWEKGKADRLLRYADYQALGRIQGILEKKATETYEKTLTPAEQVVAKRVFLELTELGEGKPDTRRLVPQTDLLSFATRTASPSRTGSPEPSQLLVEQVIAKLVKEHLIVTDQTAVTVVNIAHDALIEHWSVLRQWLDQSREDLKLQRQINEGAKAWKVGKKALLVGVDLARAEEYLGTHLERVPLIEVGVEFVQKSQEERDRVLKEEIERQQRELEVAKQLVEQSEARQQAEKKARRRAQTGVVILILTVLGLISYGSWYFYSFVWEHVTYCNTIAKRYGIMQCVGELNEQQVRKRTESYKFIQKGSRNPVWKVMAVDSRGKCNPNHKLGNYLQQVKERQSANSRICQWEFVLEPSETPVALPDGKEISIRKVVYEKSFNAEGKLVWGLVYSPSVPDQDPLTAKAHFVGDDGFPRPQSGSEANFVKFVYSKEGYETETYYVSGNDEPKPAQDGTYGKKQEFDARGLITRVTFLDQEKRPVNDGIVTGELAYDAESNLVHKAFFNALNQPVLNNSGYHKLIEKCDESGNAIETTFWGVNQEPILDAIGVHKFTQKYNEQGDVIEIIFFGVDQQPTLDNTGAHKVTQQYDKHGNVIEVAFWGIDQQPVQDRNGVHKFTRQYEGKCNHITETAFFGIDRKPSSDVQGVHKILQNYKDYANCSPQIIETTFLGINSQPVAARNGVHHVVQTYDKKGVVVETKLFGVDNQLLVVPIN